MALLVTLFLVLVNIFNSVTANAPKSEGLTAVETWVVMCILHVFCVLSEYAIILKIIQVKMRFFDHNSYLAGSPVWPDVVINSFFTFQSKVTQNVAKSVFFKCYVI